MIGRKEFTCKNINGTKVLNFVDDFNGLDGKMTYYCDSDPTYRGQLKYDLNFPIANLYYIKTEPRRTGIGALFTYLLALRANRAAIPTMRVILPNVEELVFYEQVGFYPAPEELQRLEVQHNIPPLPLSGVRLYTERNVKLGEWEARTLEVLTKSMSSVLTRWKIEGKPVGKLI